MNHRNFLKTHALGVLLWVLFQTSFANENTLSVCPIVEELASFQFQLALPFGFDSTTKSVKFITISDKLILPSELSSTNVQSNKVGLNFILYPVLTPTGVSIENSRNELIATLQSETVLPYTYLLAQNVEIKLCVYTQPGNDNTVGLVFLDPGDAFDSTHVNIDNNSTKHQRFIQLFRQFIGA